jgi:hypothetical protein
MARNPGTIARQAVGTPSEEGAVTGYRELDPVTIAMLVPGTGEPRIPDGDTTYSMPKYFALSANFQMTDTDIIIIADPMVNQTRIGIALRFGEDGFWKYLTDLNISGDLTMFDKVRSVCGRMTIQSNTRSTDSTTLDGSITTLVVPCWPDRISFSSLPSYSINTKLSCTNTLLSEGQTILGKPVYQPFEKKRQGNYMLNFTPNGKPDHTFELSPAAPTFALPGSVLTHGGRVYLRVIPHDASDAAITLRLLFRQVKGDGTAPADGQIGQELNFQGDSMQEYVGGVFVGDDQDFHGLYSVGQDGDTLRGLIVQIWFCDPIFSLSSEHMKQITYIQGSTGTKNVQINGVYGYEVIPQPANYPQTTLEPPIGSSWMPLEVFDGLLANSDIGFRLVYQGQDYIEFVKRYLDGRADSASVIAAASDGVGSASILSNIASGWKRGVKWLKKHRIDPGALLSRGLKYAIDNGYATSPSTAYATECPSNYQIQDFDVDTPSTAGIMGRASMGGNLGSAQAYEDYEPRQESSAPQGGTGSASSPAAPAGMGDTDDFDPMAAEEPEVREAQIMDPTQPLSWQDVVKAIPFQAAYDASVVVANPELAAYRRYAAFILVGKTDLDAVVTGTAIFEWAMQHREGHQYIRASELLVKTGIVKGEELTPLWTRNVGLDVVFCRGIVKEPSQTKAFKAWALDPQIRSMSVPKKTRSENAIYLTLHMPGGFTNITGYSWFGSLYALLFGKDPSVVYELGGQMTSQFGMDAFALTGVGDVDAKAQHHLHSSTSPEDPYYEALAKISVKPKMAFFFAKDTASTIWDLLKDPKRLTTDIEVIAANDSVQAQFMFVQAYWNVVMKRHSKSFAIFYSQYAQELGKYKIVVSQEDGSVSMSKQMPGGSTEMSELPVTVHDIQLINQELGKRVYLEILGALTSQGYTLNDEVLNAIKPYKISTKALGTDSEDKTRANMLLMHLRQELGANTGRPNMVTQTITRINPDEPDKTFTHTVTKRVKGAPSAARPQVRIASPANLAALLANE